MNYFDDKRIQCSDKITTYPYGYFNNDSSINSEIKDNTDKLGEIDNSGIIPNNCNTEDPLKNTNATFDINKIIDANNDSYADSAKSACIDKIKSTNANNNYLGLIKSFCEGIIKSACYEIIKDAIYADSAKSTYIDNIKSISYLDNIKSTCNDTIKKKLTYANSAKSACIDKMKSTIVKINYIDCTKSTCTDSVKSANTKNINTRKAHHKKCNTKNKYDPIAKNQLSTQAISIKYKLFKLIKLKKITKPSNNVIQFLKKRYYTH